MYIETSAPRRQGQKAQLFSATISTTQPVCVTFYYHMFGIHIGSLNVYVKTAALGQPVWTRKGVQQNQWVQGQVSINPTQNFQVRAASFPVVKSCFIVYSVLTYHDHFYDKHCPFYDATLTWFYNIMYIPTLRIPFTKMIR